MSRASEIEKALIELTDHHMTTKCILGPAACGPYIRAKAALSLPPDPPGECCRRAAEAMREAAVRVADERADVAEEAARAWIAKNEDMTAEDLYTEAQNSREIADRIRALPLPGAKEGDR